MPIIGKTDKARESEFHLDVIGRVWVGDKKPESGSGAGKTLESKFRVECSDITREKFVEFYGSDRPDRINIFLPYQHVDECFETWMESYTKTGGFQHRCNGERIIQRMVKVEYKGPKGERMYDWQRRDVDEPCLKGEKPVCDHCPKATGRFFFYVRELYSSGLGSTKGWMMTVSGIHNLLGLHQQLLALQSKYGRLDVSPVPSPGTFGYIPYTLTKVEKAFMRPNAKKEQVGDRQLYQQDGTKAKSEYWALSIAEDEEWMERLQKWMAWQEYQRLGSNPDALMLLGDDAPKLAIAAGYQQTAAWGESERNIRQATKPLQIAAAVDRVREEVGQGNMPGDALVEAEAIASQKMEAIAPKKPAKKQPVQPSEIGKRFEVVMKFTGHKWSEIKAISKLLLNGKEKPSDDTEADQLRNELLLDWAGNIVPKDEAFQMLGELLAVHAEDDEALCRMFCDRVMSIQPVEI